MLAQAVSREEYSRGEPARKPSIPEHEKQVPDRVMMIVVKTIMAAHVWACDYEDFTLIQACHDLQALAAGRAGPNYPLWIPEETRNLNLFELSEAVYALDQYAYIMETEDIYYHDALNRVLPK